MTTRFFCVVDKFFPAVYIKFYWNIGYRPQKRLCNPHGCWVSSVPVSGTRWNRRNKPPCIIIRIIPGELSQNYHKNSGRKKTPQNRSPVGLGYSSSGSSYAPVSRSCASASVSRSCQRSDSAHASINSRSVIYPPKGYAPTRFRVGAIDNTVISYC